jgi:hypothetical protein
MIAVSVDVNDEKSDLVRTALTEVKPISLLSSLRCGKE